jgi:LCP family protein required for cell wall assembly
MRNKPRAKFWLGFRPRLTKIFTPIILVLFAVGSFAGLIYMDIRSTGGFFNLNLIKNRPPEDPLAGNSVNILAMAYDTYGNDKGKFTYGELGNANADTNILIHISSDRSSVEMISIARDILTDIPDCEVTGGEVVAGRYGMFNSAFGMAYYAGGDIESGARCQVQTVEAMTGIHVNYTAVVDFEGFYEIVESLGGVSLCIPQDIGPVYYAGGLTLKAGYQKLDGWQATEYARARIGVDDSSDFSRMKRQQSVLGGIGREALTQLKALNIKGIYAFFKALMGSLHSSMPLESIVGLAYSLLGINRNNIATFTAPVESTPEEYGRLVLSAQAEDMWAKIKIDQPLFPIVKPDPSASPTSNSLDSEDQASAAAASVDNIQSVKFTQPSANVINAENTEGEITDGEVLGDETAPEEPPEFEYQLPSAQDGC